MSLPLGHGLIGVGQDRNVTIDQEDGMHHQDQRKLHGMGSTAFAALGDALVLRGFPA